MKKLLQSFILTFVVLATCVIAGAASASVMISPIYVIFDGRTRSAEVTLLNTTNQTNVYRLSWTYNHQREDGSYEKLDAAPAGQPDPATFIRFSPRQVTIPPQGRQSVRLQLQRPADLPDGEYRIHLTFKQMPKDVPMADRTPTQGVSVGLRVALGISMPVIVRQGEYDARTTIADARFVAAGKDKNTKNPQLMVKIARTGKHGTYGRLRVFWNDGSNEKQIGELNNFAVYADNPARVGYIPLTTNSIPSGKLRIVYEGDGPQRGKVFSEQVVNIGG